MVQPISPISPFPVSKPSIDLPMDDIVTFCKRWHITEFALFGSVLRDDFSPDSDIDVLVTFAPDFQRGLTETMTMKAELEVIFDRAPIDGFAASVFGGQHSKFGRIVFTRDIDGIEPFLDPREAISREQIERAAKRAGVAAEAIDETVRSLNQHLGWDITKGSAHP